jgi:hypothetical protein
MARKGRAPYPEWNCKINRTEANAIKEAGLLGFDVGFLAERYNLTKPTIRNIIAGRIWKNRKNIERQLNNY